MRTIRTVPCCINCCSCAVISKNTHMGSSYGESGPVGLGLGRLEFRFVCVCFLQVLHGSCSCNRHGVRKKISKMFLVISSIKLGQF